MQNNLITSNSLSVFETTKAERKEIVENYISGLLDGHLDPIHIHLQVKHMEAFIKAITTDERYKDKVLSEAEKYGKSFEQFNAAFQVKETGVKYDFTKCEDSEWEQLNSELEALKERIKEREAFLKTIPAKGIEVLDNETGTVSQIFPPFKTSTTTVSVTLK